MSLRFKHAVWMLVPVAGLALPALSQAAAEPRYTYVEGGWLHVDFDDINEDGDGWGIGGSYAFHKNFHAFLDYQDIDLDGSSDASIAGFGVGVDLPLRPGLDFVGRLRWIDQEIDVGANNNNDNGYGVEAGFRVMINPQLELNGAVRYVDVNENDTTLDFGAMYELAHNFALGGDIEFSNDVTAFFLKARVYFDAPTLMR